VGSFG